MKRYKINYESVPHGVISWRHDCADAVYCEAGMEVRITWQPSAGWGLSEAHYIDAQGNEVAIDTKEMAFTMPESDITIGGTFKRFVITDWEGYNGGGGSTGNYEDLENKPKINSVELDGNKTSEQLGIVVPKRIKDDPMGEGVIEGYLQGNKASGRYSHAEGGGITNIDRTIASGHCSHAEGNNTTASGIGSHAEGRGANASGRCSHAEGNGTKASGEDSHAEGKNTTASGQFSHAEGSGTTASGTCSHAEGRSTTASGTGSHAEGLGTNANRAYQRVFGKYNTVEQGDSGSEGSYAEIVGNGTEYNQRRNARTLSWDGKEWLADTLEVSREPETENEVATKGYVDGKTMKRVVVDEEKLIGEWVEGGVAYDLFEKTINFGALTNATQKSVEHGVTNFVRIVGMEGIAVSSSNILPLPAVTIDPTKGIYIACGTRNVTVTPGSDRSAFNAWVTLRFIRAKQ